jgi:hypothetical protein
MKYTKTIARALALATVFATLPAAFAAPVIFQRQLPTQNINSPYNAATPTRSNAAPIQQNYNGGCAGGPCLLGDDFILSTPSIIDSITVYMVTNTLAGTPSSEFSSIQLYGGVDAGLGLLSSSYAASKVQYNGTTDYQSLNSSTFYSVYALTYSGLNWSVVGGKYYDFAIADIPIGGNTFALHTSNAGLSGPVIEQGADGSFLFFSAGATPALTGGSNSSTIVNFGNGSDVNVIITGTAPVPEPSTFGMLAIGLGAALIKLRRK